MRAVVGALVRKDLLLELRSKESVPAMLLFSLSTFVLFRFGLDRQSVDGDLASGVLWVTLLFASVLGLNRLFVTEREEGGFDGFLLAPVDRTALFVAKALVMLAFLAAVELFVRAGLRGAVARPVARPGAARADRGARTRRRRDRGRRDARRRPRRADAGARPHRPADRPPAAAAGRDRGRAGDRAIARRGGRRPAPRKWLLVLGLYDMVFVLLALAVFDFLLED